MKEVIAILTLVLTLSVAAKADVWRWIDADGKTHFVDTMKPIYVWIDEWGELHYSDKPEHEYVLSVELMWHSTGSVDEMAADEDESGSGGYAHPGETAEDRTERERAQAYYCKRATQIYESYLNAPQLYRTNDDGERQYLNKKDAATKISETLYKRNELCE